MTHNVPLSTGLHDEAIIIRMSGSLKDCHRLQDPVARYLCYTKLGVGLSDSDFLHYSADAADQQALRYETIRRTRVRMRLYGYLVHPEYSHVWQGTPRVNNGSILDGL
jgi:hypothetical protein